ncbi:MAG: DUF4147 domain-containing protein [Gemmatimonadota bacterium]
MPASPRAILETLYHAGVRAVDPGTAVTRTLANRPIAGPSRVHLLSIGKAADRMAEAALRFLAEQGVSPAGGLVVSVEPGNTSAALPRICGDHPIPGPGSLAAAATLKAAAANVAPGDQVWVLLSGGTSSLIAAPVAHLAPTDVSRLFTDLLGSGLDIHQMNLIRKRFTTWGAGRLASALAGAQVSVLAISDVPGNNPASIGSGPVSPDPSTGREIRALLETHRVSAQHPGLGIYLDSVVAGRFPETPKPGDAAFDQVDFTIIADNQTAMKGVASEAARLNIPFSLEPALTGDVQDAAQVIVERLGSAMSGHPHCIIWGGETTVTTGADHGSGGRCQQLALVVSAALADRKIPATILAAGTDGRDGPTDAAGAIVDRNTIGLSRSGGIDTEESVRRHDAYTALRPAGALFHTGPTGTNVMDLVIGLIVPD